MKKALAILMVLAAVTGVAFADVADIAVEGDATLTWGMNLELDNTTGFNNETNWKISIPLLAKKTFSTKSEGENYAEINIVDAQCNIVGEDGDNDGFEGGDKKIDSVNAKLVFGDIYMTVAGKPGFKTNNANIWDPIKADSYGDASGEDNLHFEPGFDGYGTKIGTKTEKYDVAVKIASLGTYDEAIEDNQSKYAIGADATVTPSDKVTASATFNMAMWDAANDESSIISLGAKVTAKPVTDVEVVAALDAGNEGVNSDGDATFIWDALVSAKYASLVEAGTYVASAYAPAAGFDKDGESIMDLAAYLKVTDGDKIENVNAYATVMAYWLLSAWGDMIDDASAPIAFSFGGDYTYKQNDVNYLKPFVNVYGQNMKTVADPAEFVLKYDFGAEYGLFTNTTITAKFEAGSTADNKQDKYSATSSGIALIDTAAADDKGTFTLACKVKY